jgi:hypothetical protein
MSRDDHVLFLKNDVRPEDRLRRELNGIQRSLDRVEVQLLEVRGWCRAITKPKRENR